MTDRYRQAGVDLDAADAAKRRIVDSITSTRTDLAHGRLGAFGGMLRLPADIPDPVLGMSTDGVGTKVLVAIAAGVHDTVGEDLVNHCVNDILVHGARPVALRFRGHPRKALRRLYITPLDDVTDIVKAMRGKSRTIGFCTRGDKGSYLIRYHGSALQAVPPSLQGLDVTILHELILNKLLSASSVAYEMDPMRAKQIMSSEVYDAVFFLNPTKVEDVERVVFPHAGCRPSQRTFIPKS